ncbi:enoyl-CoA hydratase/isomerase family protein [bacterium]|nr:enoyl-CoA hydratase/isomerase family protein [bacterium]
MEDEYVGFTLSKAWSETARRFHNEFKVSVGFVNGKRCLGGMIELFMHCHYLIAEENAQLGMPEVTLPVVPGMEGCHWALRKVKVSDRGKVIEMLLTGKSVKAGKATGWLVDFAGSFDAALQKAWDVASGKGDGLPLQPVEQGAFDISIEAPSIDPSGNPSIEAGRKAIMDCMKASCGVTLSEALEVQAKHSAGFMLDKACQRGVIGSNYYKVMKI